MREVLSRKAKFTRSGTATYTYPPAIHRQQCGMAFIDAQLP
jgi:hypothetical protein